MNIKEGAVLVFVGNKHLQNKHYDNFEIGKSYKVSRLDRIEYDVDEFTGYNNDCVLFENHSHGCLLSSLKSYFVTIEDYRNNKIDKIIDVNKK